MLTHPNQPCTQMIWQLHAQNISYAIKQSLCVREKLRKEISVSLCHIFKQEQHSPDRAYDSIAFQ